MGTIIITYTLSIIFLSASILFLSFGLMLLAFYVRRELKEVNSRIVTLERIVLEHQVKIDIN